MTLALTRPARPVDPSDDWRAAASCAGSDPDLFFPGKGESDVYAKSVCRTCPARAACLDYALTHPVQGIWAGTTELDRHQLRRTKGGARG